LQVIKRGIIQASYIPAYITNPVRQRQSNFVPRSQTHYSSAYDNNIKISILHLTNIPADTQFVKYAKLLSDIWDS
jgi:hypothetical protein